MLREPTRSRWVVVLVLLASSALGGPRKKVIRLESLSSCAPVATRPSLLAVLPPSTLSSEALTKLAQGTSAQAAEAAFRLGEAAALEPTAESLANSIRWFSRAAVAATTPGLRTLATLRQAQVLVRTDALAAAAALLAPLVDGLAPGLVRDVAIRELAAVWANRDAPDAHAALAQRPWAAEAWRLVGDAAFLTCRDEEAVDFWRAALAADPLGAETPGLFREVVWTLEHFHRAEEATKARAAMKDALRAEGPWRAKHPKLGAEADAALRAIEAPRPMVELPIECRLAQPVASFAPSLAACPLSSPLSVRLRARANGAVEAVDVEGPAAACVKAAALAWRVRDRDEACALTVVVARP